LRIHIRDRGELERSVFRQGLRAQNADAAATDESDSYLFHVVPKTIFWRAKRVENNTARQLQTAGKDAGLRF
jgi:hypothetical protein